MTALLIGIAVLLVLIAWLLHRATQYLHLIAANQVGAAKRDDERTSHILDKLDGLNKTK
jgi:hypothetical protein